MIPYNDGTKDRVKRVNLRLHLLQYEAQASTALLHGKGPVCLGSWTQSSGYLRGSPSSISIPQEILYTWYEYRSSTLVHLQESTCCTFIKSPPSSLQDPSPPQRPAPNH